jgi:biotin operon repressor
MPGLILMAKVNVTINEASRCLSLLKAAGEPMVAADLAARLQLPGSRETQRRHVRAIIRRLRNDGQKIIATLQGGYWLTDDDSLWRDYLRDRQVDAKKILADTHRKKRMLADSQGQGLLFQPRMFCGCASMGVR